MILVAAPATGAAQTMLANMLLKVVAVEPLDVWHVFPRPCSTCAATLERFVLAIRPRVILGLGAEARAMLGQPALGAWVRFAQIETIVSWHPDEIEADSSRKRAVFGHLQELSKKR
jgi:uracil-DNA glycosylase